MSTKKLSKTILEGGRCRDYDKHSVQKSERMKERVYLAKFAKEPELADEKVMPIRYSRTGSFTDKLSPVYRFLDSRVGKSWAKTRRLLAEKFDVRSLPGFHVLEQHILGEIGTETEAEISQYRRKKYYIDNNNILRKSKNYEGRGRFISRSQGSVISYEEKQRVIEWLEKRLVGYVDGVLYWFHPIGYAVLKWESYQHFPQFNFLTDLQSIRQGEKLFKDEVNEFRAFSENIKDALIKGSPPEMNKGDRVIVYWSAV